MSKWLDKKLFETYKEESKNRQTTKPPIIRSEVVWQNPKAGTEDIPEVYEGRLLSDPNGLFVKRYLYHMWKVGDKYTSHLCPKTTEFSAWCPICSLVSILYNGTSDDKNLAKQMKRKERFVCNFYISADPRDVSAKEDKDKNVGKVKLYELPSKVEEKIRVELDEKNPEALLDSIFEPGDTGHNLILKVTSTKKDAAGKSYPDYSQTSFSRRQYALGTDEVIETILASRHDINAHIKGMEKPLDKIKEILVSENLFSLIQRDWEKRVNPTPVADKSPEPEQKSVVNDDVPLSVADVKTPPTPVAATDSSIMDELNKLKILNKFLLLKPDQKWFGFCFMLLTKLMYYKTILLLLFLKDSKYHQHYPYYDQFVYMLFYLFQQVHKQLDNNFSHYHFYLDL